MEIENANNTEQKVIKINDREIPLSLTMNKIEEPHYTNFLIEAVNAIYGYAQGILNKEEEVKNIISISADVKCVSPGLYEMRGAIENLNIIVLLSFEQQKTISSNCGLTFVRVLK